MGRAWPLTGRTEELRAIAELVGTADGSGIALAGAAGVGKTRLAREALGRAAGRGRVCRFVMATTSAGSVPLGAFADYAARLGSDPLARVSDVVDTVTRTSSNRGPVVVGVDDAHLLDDQSALVVHQIVRRHLATVVLTVRTGEPAPDAITALWKDEMLPRLEVQPLSKAETGSLLESVLAGQVESSTAERVWHYTRGNALYLRQLVADELAAGRCTQRSGVWIWDSRLRVSPTLAEMIDATIGRQPDPVLAVLDVLAVADPLELGVLADIAGAAAVDQAEIQALATIDTGTEPPLARLAHPMFGEIRRSRAGTMRLRHLRGRVATELGKRPGAGVRQRVRRAVLLLDSDLAPDPNELCTAATEALRLFDADLADRFAVAAVRAGGGRPAQRLHAEALVNSGDAAAAAAVYSALGDTAESTAERVAYSLATVVSIAVDSKHLEVAEEILLSVRESAAETGLMRAYGSVAALVHAAAGRSSEAVAAAVRAGSATGHPVEGFEALCAIGFVVGLGDLGKLHLLAAVAENGYALMAARYSVANARFMLGIWHLQGYRWGGLIHEAKELSDRHAGEAVGVTAFLRASTAMMLGIAELAGGDLAPARRSFRESLALTPATVSTGTVRTIASAGLATVLGTSGDHDGAKRALDDQPADQRPTETVMWDTDLVLAQAWVAAAGGMTSNAKTLLREAAAREAQRGRPAREVLLLQTAAQFGDRTAAARLTELAATVEGPRVTAATMHASALRDGDGDRLQQAAHLYQAFGDRIAAADAAAQAAMLYRKQRRRGAAMSATARAHRLALETGAETPALRANNAPIPLTDRQREIIALASTGLTNRQIAETLTMSVRTVEGHLFRASQNTGVNSREELIALIEGT